MQVNSVRKAGDLVFRLMRTLGVIESRECRCCGLTLGQALALLVLGAGRCVPMRTVAESLGVSAGTATRVMDNLVRDGLIRRADDPSDRRCVCGCLTRSGEARMRALEECYESFWLRVFGGIPEEELPGIMKNLEKVVLAAEQAKKTCCGTRPEKTGGTGRRKR